MDENLKAIKDERLGRGLGDGNGLSWTCNYCQLVGEQEITVSPEDMVILRSLAKRVAEIAVEPAQEEKKKRWSLHNGLTETEPLIFCDPELAWYEVIPASQLKCTTNLGRIWEFKLRKEIFWAERIQDDRVIQDEFTVHYIYRETSRGKDVEIVGGEHSGAYNWQSVISDYSQVDELKFKEIIIDYDKTERLLALAKEVFEGILTVRLEGSYWWSFGMTGELILLRGFEQVLMDMYDEPEGIHKLMAFLRDEHLERLKFLEDSGCLSLNNGGDFIGTGGYGWTDDLPQKDFNGKVRLTDMWGFAESQETVNVSPEFFREFVLPYQISILRHFGLNIYGCCEPLDKRWQYVRDIPQLRRVTVSPWSNAMVMAENLGRDYVYCRKINPAYMATSNLSEDDARRELQETFEATRRFGCPAEVMLRDVITLGGNPENAVRWTQIAREEARRYYR